MGNTLLFGATGAIGQQIRLGLLSDGRTVTSCARNLDAKIVYEEGWFAVNPFSEGFSLEGIRGRAPFDSVIWAQGMNGTDSVYDVQPDHNLEMYKANCLYIVITLKALLQEKLLVTGGAKLVVISSIWQNIARQDKLSYTMTKSALQGLIKSASADLGRDGHLINAILPGPLDTPMTRRNISAEQLAGLESATGFGALPQVEDVVNLAVYLSSQANRSVTGQFVAVDLGFSHVRLV